VLQPYVVRLVRALLVGAWPESEAMTFLTGTLSLSAIILRLDHPSAGEFVVGLEAGFIRLLLVIEPAEHWLLGAGAIVRSVLLRARESGPMLPEVVHRYCNFVFKTFVKYVHPSNSAEICREYTWAIFLLLQLHGLNNVRVAWTENGELLRRALLRCCIFARESCDTLVAETSLCILAQARDQTKLLPKDLGKLGARLLSASWKAVFAAGREHHVRLSQGPALPIEVSRGGPIPLHNVSPLPSSYSSSAAVSAPKRRRYT
jgi:hypothetical protein